MGKSKDRVLGALLGVAVGDALGGPLEFCSAEEIQAQHGGPVREMIGGGWLNLAPGEITDDTEMTLAVAEGIVESPEDPIPAIGRRFIEWHDSGPRDIGNCCRAAIWQAKMTNAASADDWHRAAKHVHEETGGQTAGNGALMRTIYPIIYYKQALFYDSSTMAELIGQMTHWAEQSTLAIRAYALAVENIIEDGHGGDEDRRKRQLEHHMKSIRKATNPKTLRPDGYVLNGLVYAINAIRDTDSFEDALVQVVNLGGDADTIGAITGGLAGAIYGARAIPSRWTDALDKGIVQAIERLAELAVNNK